MPLNLQIPDSQIPAARELYKGIAKEVWGRLQSVKREWDELLPILKQLGLELPPSLSATAPTMTILNGYNTKWSWGKKAKYVILKNGPLTAKKIVEILVDQYETNLDTKHVGNNVPATLSVDARDGKFKRIEKNGEFVYDIVDRDKTIEELNNH